MSNKKTSMDIDYYDIEVDINKIASESLNDAFTLQDLKQRKLFLETEVDQYSVSDIIKNIMQYNHDDNANGIPVGKRIPIKLYIASNGGSVDAGFSLIDTIVCSETPVLTINTGYAYSMSVLILIAGHKRYALPSARHLLHDGSNFVYDSTSKVKDRMEFEEIAEARLKDFVLKHSKLSSETYDNNLRKEWYMFADEAKSLGFIDYIIGEDCKMNEVV